jgi:hypothetical protein
MIYWNKMEWHISPSKIIIKIKGEVNTREQNTRAHAELTFFMQEMGI